MGVRPPQNDVDDDPDAIEFGIAALAAHLEEADVSFPATAEEVIDALADPQIDYDASGGSVALSTALERTDRESFDSETDLLDALHPVFEEYRRSSGAGVFGWLRSLLPGR